MSATATNGAITTPGPATSALLRLATAGSVDDGKSTLIGRLLYDAKAILADQLSHVEEASRRRGGNGALDLALLTDGLRAEREQGITIDVAYRSFATAHRRFVIADTPGHVQYTRNMVTGASLADVALVLVDARRGVVEQSRRHAFLAGLLRVPHLVVAVNKMDLAGFSEDAFAEVEAELRAWTASLPFASVDFVPVSALHGDHVVERSARMPWHEGPALLELLEALPSAAATGAGPARFPVQWVIRPRDDTFRDFRGYAGQLAGGALAPGDEVVVLPAGHTARVAAVETWDGPLARAAAPRSVTVRLEEDLDVSRGDLICAAGAPARVARTLDADVCWMDEEPLRSGARYALKHTTRQARAIVEGLVDRVELDALARDPAPDALHLNEIGRVRLRTSAPLAVDPYAENRTTGSFILIDEATNATVGAGMIGLSD